ncbi:cyclic nucleotide-binding domain-containing protein [Listeria valentina]|uniref:cyclic nucleotide-binding domain-containing protein n=1 Tax=Listeria valentina TaxID=2705293 RepID=UPI0014317086|nr:cyclic nucleotide-binding domain-containing protein [Listeria valentina]
MMIIDNDLAKEWYPTFWKSTYFKPQQICYSTKEVKDDRILIIKKGTLIVQVATEDGKKIHTEILTKGNVINAEALIENHSEWVIKDFIHYQVIALDNVEIYEIEKEFFLSHLYLDPRKYHQLIEEIIKQFITVSFSHILANKKTAVKISWALVRIAKQVGEKLTDDLYRLPSFANRTFISQIAGAGKARTSEAIRELDDYGIFERCDKELIISRNKLQEYLKAESFSEYSVL